MLRHLALLRTDVSKGRSASIIRVTRIGEVGKTLAVTSNPSKLRRNTMCFPNTQILVTLMLEALNSTENSVLTRNTRRNKIRPSSQLPLLNPQFLHLSNIYQILKSLVMKS
jgi:hypothetical protein